MGLYIPEKAGYIKILLYPLQIFYEYVTSKKPTNKKSSLILKDLQAERKVAQKDRHSGGRVRKDICRVIQ